MAQNLNQNTSSSNYNDYFIQQPQPQSKSLDETSIIGNNNNNSTTSCINSNPKAAIVTVEVPVAVPVQVPVAVPVYVPITVTAPDSTTVEQQLKEQQAQQLSLQPSSLPQTSDYVPLSSTSTTSTNDVNEHNKNDSIIPQTLKTSNENENELLSRDSLNLTEFKNNIKDNLNSVIETGKNQLGLNKEQQAEETKLEKPQSAIFSEEKQPLVLQALEEEDKKSASDTYITPIITENEPINNNFEANEFHDIKKEHKNIQLAENENNYSLNSLMNQAKETFHEGIETIKNNLGFNNNPKKSEELLLSEEKQPLMKQPLEEQDKTIVHNIDNKLTSNINNNFEINELHDIKKEHKEKPNVESESRRKNIMNQTTDILNSGVETFKNTIGFNSKEDKKVLNEEFEQEKQFLMRQPLENEDKQRINNNNTDLSNIKQDSFSNLTYEQPIILQGNADSPIGINEEQQNTKLDKDNEKTKTYAEVVIEEEMNKKNRERLEDTKEMNSF